ncbi:MAG: hypothetical protein CME16_03395 [Gemmatimonadetes bacterium]|nr:hypothetical protein [Gemmatimonadota bacterium]
MDVILGSQSSTLSIGSCNFPFGTFVFSRAEYRIFPRLAGGHFGGRHQLVYGVNQKGLDAVNDDEKYLFDLAGYLVLRQVLTPEDVARCNEAIDCHQEQLVPHERRFEGESKALTSPIRQLWLEGMMAWERPYCEPFRELLVQPKIQPYLSEILGGGYRLDHEPSLVAMEKGCAGHYMHGGGVERLDFSQTYMYKQGRIFCGMTVVEFMLADEGPGDGGLAIVPGGHKSNFPLPRGLHHYEEYQDYVKEIHCKAGDAVIFSEATTHGTLKWQAEHQRRTLIYRYSPRFQALARGFHADMSYPAYVEDMTGEQRQLMRPPGG